MRAHGPEVTAFLRVLRLDPTLRLSWKLNRLSLEKMRSLTTSRLITDTY